MLLLFLVFLLNFLSLSNAQTSERYLQLTDFGVNGTRLPTLFGEPPSSEFFENPFALAMEDTLDYNIQVELDNNYDGDPGEVFLLTLINKSGANSTIGLSFVDKKMGVIENFAVEVRPYSELTIDASAYAFARRIDLVSIQDFAVSFALPNGEQVLSFDAIAPGQVPGLEDLRVVGNYYYCKDIFVKMRIEHISGSYTDAWINRFYRFDGAQACNGFSWVPKFYGIEVYWPSSTTLHHKTNGATHECPNALNCGIRGELPCYARCVNVSYSTSTLEPKLIDRTSLWWEHVGGGKYYVDDVLFGTECGRVICNEHMLGGKCLDDPNTGWFWYFYYPGNRPNCFINP